MVLRRGSVWYTNFEFGGRRIRASTGATDRGLAEQAEARLKQQLWLQAKLGERPERRWKEAVVEYARYNAHKRTLANDLAQLDRLTPTLDAVPLHLITNAHINRAIHVQDRRLSTERVRGWKVNRGMTAATRNRYRAVVRRLLNLAADHWDWIERAPKVHMEPEHRDEARWLTPQEAEALLAACTGPRAHWRAPVALALSTGLRAGNVFGLQWAWVDLPRRVVLVPGRSAKAKRTLAVPLNAYAAAVIAGEAGKHPEYVITEAGRPMTRICPARFKACCASLGIDGATFHSLRHTWAAWHIMAGTPLYDLMVMGGWTSLAMLQKTYGHLSTAHLAASAERILGTNLVTDAAAGVELTPAGA